MFSLATAQPQLVTMATVLLTVIALSSIVALSRAPYATADENNILLTGDTLSTDSQLSYAGAVFVMQNDCNVVLYNKGSGFQSGTSGAGSSCMLTLNDLGEFVVANGGGATTVWTSTPTITATKKGNYAAVLRPDGQVAIYGPAVWSTPPLSPAEADPVGAELADIPLVRNVLFSSQVLYDNSKLATRDYTFVMQDDCNLVYNKAASRGIIWQSGTAGKGKHCFLRLDHRGQLAVQDDHYKTLWTSKSASKLDGDYVLVVQINGQAVVYGPIVWSTPQ